MQDLPINTPLLRLRHFVQDDAGPMMALNAEASTSRWLPSHVYPNFEVASSRIAYLISCYASPGSPQHGPYVLAVELKNQSKLLGHVGFSPFEKEVEVSYAIAEAFRGKGYGTEALVHACIWAAHRFTLPRVLAITESANALSRRLLERSAFVRVKETSMMFQGKEQVVSNYYWYPSVVRDGMNSPASSGARERAAPQSTRQGLRSQKQFSAITIEPLNPRERAVASSIHSVQLAAYTQEAQLLGVSNFPPLERTVDEVQTSDELFFGASLGGALVGVAAIEASKGQLRVYISSLVVLPEAQRSGVATALLQEVLRRFAQNVVVVSTAAENTRALALYKRFGFIERARSFAGKLDLVQLERSHSE
jgi:RimJ/RimL family protein N-acetyltransferase